MANLSKILHYTCYEAAHTWNPSCTNASVEVLLIAFINGLKIYSAVYVISTFLIKRKWTKDNINKLLRDILRSSCFISVNAGAFIGGHCLIRAILGHINFISAAYIPGFIASLLAVLVERSSRRSTIALYVTNIVSECIWNILVSRKYVTPLPYGETLLFASTMAIFGFYFKYDQKFSPMVMSILKYILGKDELSAFHSNKVCADDSSKSSVKCFHKSSCVINFLKKLGDGFLKGFLLQTLIRVLPSAPRIILNPSILRKRIIHSSCFNMGLFFSWFSASFQGVCCLARRLTGKDEPLFSSIAGAVAGLGMIFSPTPSVSLYALWKAIEAIFQREQDAGRLPVIPFGVELLYATATAYLFHLAIMENFNLKPSYWRFLLNLTSGRIGAVNRHLLYSYELDSARIQGKWPKYDVRYLTEDFKREFASRLGLTSADLLK